MTPGELLVAVGAGAALGVTLAAILGAMGYFTHKLRKR